MTNSMGMVDVDSGVTQSKSERIEQLLKLACASLGMLQGVLLRISDDFAEVISRAIDTLPPQLTLIPNHPHINEIALPQSHVDASEDVKHWAHLHLGAREFVRGKVHRSTVDSHVLVFVPPSDMCIEQLDSIKLALVDGWLESLLSHEERSDSFRHRALYEKLQSVANIGTWEVNLVNERISWSSQTRVIHEVDESYQPSMETAIYFYKEGFDRDEISRQIKRTIETGAPWTSTLKLVTAKGNEVWVESHGMAEMIDGVCVRLFGTFQDVSKSMALRIELDKQRGEAIEAYNARGELLSRISHELRTPLNGITGMLQSLRFEQRDKIRKKKAELALRSANKLLQLINDVLDYTEISNGRFTLNPSDFSALALAEDIIEVAKPQCEEKGVTLYTHVDVPKDTYLNGDAARIGQVIDNLISNAIKYTHQGHVRVTLTLDKSDHSPAIHILVEDTGEGMSRATVESIFTPLIHGDKTSISRNTGSGLGLTIVKQIIDKMGGNISVETELGSGSAFEATLPVEYACCSDKTSNDNNCIPKRLLKVPLALLVVDDNDINRMVLKSMLEQYNYVADEAEDGQIAIEKAKSKQYDIIFMDCAMPVRDGMSASKFILEKGYLAEHGKIVAVTANTTEDDKAACKGAGMAEFLSKPVDQNAIFAILKAMLLNKEGLVQQC